MQSHDNKQLPVNECGTDTHSSEQHAYNYVGLMWSKFGFSYYIARQCYIKTAHHVPDSMQPCHSNHYDVFTEITGYYYTLINVYIADQKPYYHPAC